MDLKYFNYTNSNFIKWSMKWDGRVVLEIFVFFFYIHKSLNTRLHVGFFKWHLNLMRAQ